MTQLVAALPLVTDDQRARIVAAPRTSEAHRALMADIPAMHMLEIGGTAAERHLPAAFTTVAWNVERCLFPDKSAAFLARHSPDVVLLSEMDSGMARTGQCNTTADVAAYMGMRYAFGVEFHELDLGDATERAFCKDDFNAAGWHGNAILSRVPFISLKLIRLDDHGHWFVPEANAKDPRQPRVGGRMAIAALLETDDGPLCVVTTHLESNADANHRLWQFKRLLAEIDELAMDAPVIIGGDLNTGNHLPPNFDWRDESLFDFAESRGYSWQATPPGMTTRKSLITPHPTRQMKLDWFCTRGLSAGQSAILPALSPDGVPLSDHDPVIATFRIG